VSDSCRRLIDHQPLVVRCRQRKPDLLLGLVYPGDGVAVIAGHGRTEDLQPAVGLFAGIEGQRRMRALSAGPVRQLDLTVLNRSQWSTMPPKINREDPESIRVEHQLGTV
jgi:hypothetical protein